MISLPHVNWFSTSEISKCSFIRAFVFQKHLVKKLSFSSTACFRSYTFLFIRGIQIFLIVPSVEAPSKSRGSSLSTSPSNDDMRGKSIFLYRKWIWPDLRQNFVWSIFPPVLGFMFTFVGFLPNENHIPWFKLGTSYVLIISMFVYCLFFLDNVLRHVVSPV